MRSPPFLLLGGTIRAASGGPVHRVYRSLTAPIRGQSAGQDALRAVGRHGPCEQKALAQTAARGDQELELGLVLDALGDDVAAACLGELQDRRDDRGRLRL